MFTLDNRIKNKWKTVENLKSSLLCEKLYLFSSDSEKIHRFDNKIEDLESRSQWSHLKNYSYYRRKQKWRMIGNWKWHHHMDSLTWNTGNRANYVLLLLKWCHLEEKIKKFLVHQGKCRINLNIFIVIS